MLLEFLAKHKKVTLISVISFFAIIILISAYFLIRAALKTATVNIYVAPAIATVKIGDNKYDTMETVKIEPGEYEVEIFAEGFIAQKGTITAVDGGTAEIKAFLEPEEWNENYYNENPGDALVVGEIKAEKTQEALNKLTESNPVIAVLPIEIDYFTKDYAKRIKYTISVRVADNYESFVIVITDYTGGNYDAAIEKLVARGFEPTKFIIEYVDATQDLESWRAE